MKKILLVLAISFMLVCESLYAETSVPSDPVKHAMSSFMRRNHVPGAAVALIDHGKAHVYVFGVANHATAQPVTDQTIFEVGSITKLLTTLLVADEIKQNRLQLSTPVSDVLPELKENPGFKQITLENLATYTSGLPFTPPDDVKTKQQLQLYLESWKPNHEVGSSYQYSNMGIGLLGMAMQNQTHQKLNQIYRERILEPLHMYPLGTRVPALRTSDLAQGYTAQGLPDSHLPNGLFPAAGSLKASIADMKAFLAAALCLPGTPKNLVDAMQFSQIPRVQVGDMQQALGWQVYPISNPDKLLHVTENTNLKSIPVKWLQVQQFNPKALIDKTGATYGMRAYVAVIPSKKSGIVVLTNRYVSNAAIEELGRKILITTAFKNKEKHD